jgi:hypothetical protein
LALVPGQVARQHLVLPLAFDGEILTLASADPGNVALADTLRFLLAKDVRLVPADRETLGRAIERHYGGADGESCDSMLAEPDADVACSAAPPSAVAPSGRGRQRATGGRVHALRSPGPSTGLDPTKILGGRGMFFEIVEEGQRVLMRRPNGTIEILAGPRRIWRGRSVFRPMAHYVAHPGEYLIVRYRNGSQEHLPGPAEVWFDPRTHQEIAREDALQIAAKEAVVVYSRPEGAEAIARRIVGGPALFVPRPGEWLHTFSWHGSAGGSRGVEKTANSLVFQKLWLMPDQMYHDVDDVRTADGAVLTIRLMVFFELLDIERMLDATHDPIGDFINAATSDVVDYTGRYEFDAFKRNTEKLNELETYRQLTIRAEKCGYRISKVVYRGYGAPASLQQMHDQAIEARTRLQLERDTEKQAQDLEDYKLASQLARAAKRRAEQTQEVEHDLELARKRQRAEIEREQVRQTFSRRQAELDAETQLTIARNRDAQHQQHLAALREMGVNLTAYLTQSRADRVIEIRGEGHPHIHLDPDRGDGSNGTP